MEKGYRMAFPECVNDYINEREGNLYRKNGSKELVLSQRFLVSGQVCPHLFRRKEVLTNDISPAFSIPVSLNDPQK